MDGEDPQPEESAARPRGALGWVRWSLRTEQPAVRFLREVLATVLTVALVGVLLFAISGVWPPLVAVESGSMEPHMSRGDLVFIVEADRYGGRLAVEGTGVVPADVAAAADYTKFGGPGDVIVYRPNGDGGTPIIHRARFWVSEGENWYDRADPNALRADSCRELRHCPAPHSGFITRGDANRYYDQSNAAGISAPVRPAWIRGTAEVRIPWLGYVRLGASELSLDVDAGDPLWIEVVIDPPEPA